MQHVSYLERNRGHSIWRVFGRRQCAPGRGHPISQKASFAGVVPGPAVIACRRRAWRLDSLRLIDLPGKALQSLLATYSHFLRLCWLVSLLSCSRKASSCGRGHLFSRPARDDLLPQCHADVVHICLRRLHGRRADSRGDPVAAAAPPARPCQPRAGQQPAPAGHAPVRWRAVLRDRRIVWRATHGDAPAPVAHHRAYDSAFSFSVVTSSSRLSLWHSSSFRSPPLTDPGSGLSVPRRPGTREPGGIQKPRTWRRCGA